MATSVREVLFLIGVVTICLLGETGVNGQVTTQPSSNEADCKIDLAILVDMSGSIVDDRQDDLQKSPELAPEIMRDWYAVTNFTSAIISRLSVGEGATHAALVTFASSVNTIFDLSNYDRADMLAKVQSLAEKVPDGETNAFGALKTARDEIFSIGGAGNRAEVVDVIIMITDGAPTEKFGGNNMILQETDSLKSRGFIISAVGVGDGVNTTLLQLMVNSPNSTYYFPVDNFQGLERQLESIINQTCQKRIVDTFSVDCAVDLAFILDSSGSVEDSESTGGGRNWDQVIDFTIRVVRSYTWNVSSDIEKPRVASITFSNGALLDFNLLSYNTEAEYIQALSNITYQGGLTNTAAALRKAYEEIFTPEAGDRAGVQNVIIMITDGIANRDEALLPETVEQLNAMGVHIIVVFISTEEPPELYLNIASQPESDYFRIDAFNQISSIYKNVTVQTCEDFFTGCTSEVDLYLVLDASGSIGEENFKAIKRFVVFLIADIAFNNTRDVRIGLITFSDGVQSIFTLNSFTNTDDMISAVENIGYTRGTTNTAEALRYLRETGFTIDNGDRAIAPNVAVILTDGNSNNKEDTLEQAYFTKGAGIHLITVGIGDWTNVFELQSIASYPYHQNYLPIPTFSDLNNKLRYQLKNIVCNDEDPCGSSPCQCGGTCVNYIGGYICQCPPECAGRNCDTTCKNPKDLAVALDASSSVREANFRLQLDFVQEMVLMMNFNEGMRLALMGYSDDAYVRFHLNEHMTKLDVLNALSLYYARGSTNMHLVLRKMYQEVFTANNGDRQDFDNVGLLLTDGRPSNRSVTWAEAMAARERDIELVTMAIGTYWYMDEMEDLATGPALSHIYTTHNFTTLVSAASDVLQAVCNNEDECEPGFCKNGGTPVDLINRCECECPDTTSGPDCSRGCVDKYDIYLVLDVSGSIRRERFKDLLEFVVDVVRQFQVGRDMARFALVHFSDSAYVSFNLDSYFSLQDVIAAIRRTPFLGGRTNIADALDLVDSMYETAGDRADVKNHVIVITDGQSNMRERETMKSAIRLRSDTGAKVTALGIGKDANSLELRGIASDPVPMMAFFITSLNDLLSSQEARDRLLNNIIVSTCDDVDECDPNPCESGGICVNDLHQYWCDCPTGLTGRDCSQSCSISVDLTFVLDFSGSMDSKFEDMIEFAHQVTYGLPIGLTRIAVVSYDTVGTIHFFLDEYNSLAEILNAMVFSKVQGGTTNTQEAIFMMYSQIYTSNRGDRQGSPNVAVVLTDGRSNVNSQNTIPRAEDARDNDVEVFVAAFGPNPDYSEINGIASDPDGSHVIAVPNNSSVPTAAKTLLVDLLGCA